jgi:hypothetical protein
MASWRQKLLLPRGVGEIRYYHTEWEVPEFECLTSQWCTNVNHTSNWWQLTRPLQMDNVLRFYWGYSNFNVTFFSFSGMLRNRQNRTNHPKTSILWLSYKPRDPLCANYPKHYRVFRYVRPPWIAETTVSIHTIYASLESKISFSQGYIFWSFRNILSMHCVYTSRLPNCTILHGYDQRRWCKLLFLAPKPLPVQVLRDIGSMRAFLQQKNKYSKLRYNKWGRNLNLSSLILPAPVSGPPQRNRCTLEGGK